MIIHCLTLSISLLFIITIANVDQTKSSAINIAVAEHGPSDLIANDTSGQSWPTTTEKTLIRVPRLNTNSEKTNTNKRQRRQMMDTEEIWGMAKKVAITVFVVVSLCIVFCLVTTIFMCVKCCCGGNNKQKRNHAPATIQVPQPIFIHTGSSNYQQQAPTWNPESRPMLPQPSAPPQPYDDFHMEHPPPYETVCTGR